MQHSATFVSMPAVPADLFERACALAVARNAEFVPPHETGAAMYIRPLLLGSSAQLGLNPPEEYTFCVFVMPTGVYHGAKPVDAVILERFDRAAPHGTGSAKIGGNYAPVLRWSEKAKQDGFGITLHLDSRSHTVIDEFSTSGFIGVKAKGDVDAPGADVTLIVPDSQNVIKSVTSDSACRLAESLGWKVECREVRMLPGLCTGITVCRFHTRSSLRWTRSWPPARLPPWFRSNPSPCSPRATDLPTWTVPTRRAQFARSC